MGRGFFRILLWSELNIPFYLEFNLSRYRFGMYLLAKRDLLLGLFSFHQRIWQINDPGHFFIHISETESHKTIVFRTNIQTNLNPSYKSETNLCKFCIRSEPISDENANDTKNPLQIHTKQINKKIINRVYILKKKLFNVKITKRLHLNIYSVLKNITWRSSKSWKLIYTLKKKFFTQLTFLFLCSVKRLKNRFIMRKRKC